MGHLAKGLNLSLSLGLVKEVPDEVVLQLFDEMPRDLWDKLPKEKFTLTPKRWQKILKGLDKSTGTGLFNASNTIQKSIADLVMPTKEKDERSSRWYDCTGGFLQLHRRT